MNPENKLKDNPILSIVIPTWNRQNEVVRALDSVRALFSNHACVELIVSDNASSDNTVAEIEKWNAEHGGIVSLLVSDSNMGPVLNWIKGISQANGYYVILLFSDDFLDFSPQSLTSEFINELYNASKAGVSLIRLPVKIVDNNLQISRNNDIHLLPSYQAFSVYTSNSSFLLNHLIPRSFKIRSIERSFSPVSPTGYVIQRDKILNVLTSYLDRHTYKINGAGIDQLSILFAASQSKKVGFFQSPTSVMVASSTSITHSSKKSRSASFSLSFSYYLSQFDFAKDALLSTKKPIYLLFLLIALARMSKIFIVRFFSK